MTVSLDCIVQRNDDIIFTDLDDTIVMMDPEQGTYYELDAVGTQIWTLLENASSVTDLCDALAVVYDVTPDVCRRDVLEFIEKVLEMGVVRVRVAEAP